MVSLSDIQKVAQRIGQAAHAESVILFGSHARAEATENSDVDLLVVADSDLPRHKRSRELYLLFRPYPFGMDIDVYTPDELDAAGRTPLSFVSTVLREGKTLYTRED